MKKAVYILPLLILGSCTHLVNNTKVVLPSTPPLSAEVVEQTANSCQKEIEYLKSKSPYVPKERREEFYTVIKIAQKACTQITDTLSKLRSATHNEQILRQSIEHAKNTMVPGAIVSDQNTLSKTNKPLADGIESEPLN